MPRNSADRKRQSPSSLPKPALRLLETLAQPGVTVRPDPTRDGFVVLRDCRSGVSLGRGSQPRGALDDLVRRDLVEGAGPAGECAVSAAGRAWLARRASPEAEGEAFGRQHREMARAVVGAGPGQEVAVNLGESPLSWLRRRRGPDGEPLIDAAAFEAGERLRRDITMAGLMPSVTARWDGAVGGGAGAVRDPSSAADSVVAARQRVRAASVALGAEFADLLIDLCGFLKGVETIERERRWPQRSGKVVIRLALGQLARHYGLSNEARGEIGSRRVRTWFAEEAA